MTEDMTLVEENLKEIKRELHIVMRAVVGAPLEGNPGLIQRMDKMERRTSILIWLSPVWIATGTSVGTLLARWWGI